VFTLSRRRIIIAVVLTAMLLITLDKNGNGAIERGRSLFARVLQPFDTAVEAVALPVERAWNGITQVDDLQRENDALRDQLARAKGAELEAESAILAYRELLKLNLLTAKFQYKVVAAQVVGDSPSNFQNTVEINVGSNRGIQVGMPVTDGAGLVGRITRVFPESSVVLLITDPEYSINAQVLSTQEQIDEETAPSSTAPSGVPVENLTSTTTTSTTVPPSTSLPPILQPVSTSTSTPASSSVPPTTLVETTTTTELRVVRETGTLAGQGADRPLVLRFIDTTSSVTTVRVGSIVDTAGGNTSLAPQGIPIGRISAIVEQPGTSSYLIEVRPNASLDRLNFIAVVLYVPANSSQGG